MRNAGRRTPKDDIIDHIEDQVLGGEGLSDDEVERLHRISAADLFLLQRLFFRAYDHGRKRGKEER